MLQPNYLKMVRTFLIGNKVISKNLYHETFFSLFLIYYKKGSCKFLLVKLLPSLKEMRFITKRKALSNFYQFT